MAPSPDRGPPTCLSRLSTRASNRAGRKPAQRSRSRCEWRGDIPLLAEEGRREAPGWSVRRNRRACWSDHPVCAFGAAFPSSQRSIQSCPAGQLHNSKEVGRTKTKDLSSYFLERGGCAINKCRGATEAAQTGWREARAR